MYRVVADEAVEPQLNALPTDVMHAYLEVRVALELTPWNGRPINDENPNAAVRRWDFGPEMAGHVVYLVLEDQRLVDILMVQWMG